jgi:hypothetical protein
MDEDLVFDDAELEAAEKLDSVITDVLAGRAGHDADLVALWLASSTRDLAPLPLVARLRGRVSPANPPRRLVRSAAAALALLFLVHGVTNVAFSDWLAAQLGEEGTHALYEGGLAMLTAAVAVGACLLRRAWTPISVASGVPLGVGLGLHGLTEIGEFAAGVALHTLEGLAALTFLVAWLLERRDRPAVQPEEGS